MRNVKIAAALSLCLGAATCTAAQEQAALNGAAAVAPAACSAIYAKDANKAALCTSYTGVAITIAQASANGETK